jgi:hypothetical protein
MAFFGTLGSDPDLGALAHAVSAMPIQSATQKDFMGASVSSKEDYRIGQRNHAFAHLDA